MSLVALVLGFVTRKLALLGMLVLSLFLVLLLTQAVVPTVRQAAADREQLAQLAQERAQLEGDLRQLRAAAAQAQTETIAARARAVDAEIDRGRRAVAERASEVEKRLRERDEACGFVKRAVAAILPRNPCEAAERTLQAAEATLDAAESTLRKGEETAAILGNSGLTRQQKLDRVTGSSTRTDVDREIADKEARLAATQADEERLEQTQTTVVGRVVDQWARSWKVLTVIALLVLVMPVVLRTVNYFLLMPLVRRAHRPIHLAGEPATVPAGLSTSVSQRTLPVSLADGEVLSARSEHVRPVQGEVRSRLLYDWGSPFISFAAGLHGLSRVTGTAGGSAATLATPDDPDSYLMRIDFSDHPGVVVHPRHVVGVIGSPELTTRWRWGVQALATWQVRYIMFAGTGSLIVQGSGDVVATSPGGRSSRMEQNLVMGFDSRLAVGVNRTEVFWPYLRGKTPLVDDEFTGDHPFLWQKADTGGPRNPVARTFHAMFSALGKLLGF